MPTKYLGNLVISMRSIKAVLEQCDDVTLLVDDSFLDLVRVAFGPDPRIVVYPRRAVAEGGAVARLSGYFRFMRMLRAVRYDCALDIDGTVVSARVMRMCRAERKVGPTFAKRLDIYNEHIEVVRETQHCFEDFALMVEAIGVHLESRNYMDLPTVDPALFADQLQDMPDDVASAIDSGSPIACIHPCATKDYKQWDIEKFAGLVDRLQDKGYKVVIIGAGAGERLRVDKLLSTVASQPVDAHGRLSLVQVVYLLQRASVFIGNDSGPMHLAAVCRIPVLALFGPTELHRWRPRSDAVLIIKGEQPCSPECRPEACLNAYRCMRSLTISQVDASLPHFGKS